MARLGSGHVSTCSVASNMPERSGMLEDYGPGATPFQHAHEPSRKEVLGFCGSSSPTFDYSILSRDWEVMSLTFHDEL